MAEQEEKLTQADFVKRAIQKLRKDPYKRYPLSLFRFQ